MSTPLGSRRPLTVPTADPAHFATNFIRQAVCEIRFPTLFELEAERPPVDFAHALRKEYPFHSLVKSVNVSQGGVSQASNAHTFRSKNGRWTVSLRAAALSLESTQYDSFHVFEQRLSFVLKAAERVIDSDFLTRVGLRYINAVPFDVDRIGQWVNPTLVEALARGVYGDVDEHSQRVRGATAEGGYTFQHGVSVEPTDGKREYVLDFDFFREDVGVAEALTVVRRLHDLEFAMFVWSLGDAAKSHLGPSNLKGLRSD